MKKARLAALGVAIASAVAIGTLVETSSPETSAREGVARAKSNGTPTARMVTPAARLRADVSAPAGASGPSANAASRVADPGHHEHGEGHDCQGRGDRPCGTGTGSTFDALVSRLLAAVRSGDEELRVKLREELHVFADADLERARDLILAALAGAEGGPDADELAAVLVDTVEAKPPAEMIGKLADLAARDPRGYLRAAAARALGDLPYPDLERVALAAKIVRDGDESVRQAGAAALGRMAERNPEELGARVAREAVQALAAERSPFARSVLVHAVRDASEPATLDALLDTLATDVEPAVRRSCADVLGALTSLTGESGDRARKALTARYASEPDEDVRSAIALALSPRDDRLTPHGNPDPENR